MLRHVHSHVVLPGGGFSLEGGRWVSSPGRQFFLDAARLADAYRDTYLRSLRRKHREGELIFPGALAPLVDEAHLARVCYAGFLGNRHRRENLDQARTQLADAFGFCKVWHAWFQYLLTRITISKSGTNRLATRQAATDNGSSKSSWKEAHVSDPKETMISIITRQPDDSSYEEILRELTYARMVHRGLDDSDAGRTVCDDDMKKKIELWQK